MYPHKKKMRIDCCNNQPSEDDKPSTNTRIVYHSSQLSATIKKIAKKKGK